jgi:glycosyltransferase 2 family protein
MHVFSAPPGQPRARRATDVLLLVPALLGLALVVALYPPSRFERSLTAFLDSFPGWLAPVWELAYDLTALGAVALIVLAVVARRGTIVLQVLASVVVAAALATIAFRLALDRWPEWDYLLRLHADDGGFPVLRVAVCAAAILAVLPHLVRPLEKVGRWIVVVGALAAVLVEHAPPSGTLAAWLVAVVAATLVRLAFGTSAGHPEAPEVEAVLRSLGVPVMQLEPVARQPAGAFVARGVDDDGQSLLVKVYGRDAYDTHLLEKAWRTLWYQGEGTRLRFGRLDAVEHEALVTLLARQAGVTTPDVVLAAESPSGDALLVLRRPPSPLTGPSSDAVDDEILARAWEALGRLHGARIAHLAIAPHAVTVWPDGRVGLAELDRATLAPRPDQFLIDRAQLLATSAVVVGPERAIDAGVASLGVDGVIELLPYLQPAALGGRLRRALKDAAVETDDLRDLAAERVGAAPPELLRLQRVTWWTLAQVALLALAVSTIIGGLSGLDYETLLSDLEDASWGWVAAGLVVAQLPRLTQAVSTIGTVAARLPFAHVYVMQLATGYMNVALPSNFARMAVNIRFFQRHGVPPAAAVTSGAIDSFASTIVQALLLAALVLFSASSLDLDLDLPSGPSVTALAIVVAVALLTVATLVVVRRIRRAITDRVRTWWPEVRDALRGLRASNKLGLLIGGTLATELLFATALGVFANALGYDIGLADLLVINISVSLLASFVPVPGGIGVAEFGLTVGLVAAGMPDELALAAAVLYRVATFYLPPLWGFFAMRWLQRQSLL